MLSFVQMNVLDTVRARSGSAFAIQLGAEKIAGRRRKCNAQAIVTSKVFVTWMENVIATLVWVVAIARLRCHAQLAAHYMEYANMADASASLVIQVRTALSQFLRKREQQMRLRPRSIRLPKNALTNVVTMGSVWKGNAYVNLVMMVLTVHV
jgi:hypothetical protein